VYLSPWHLTAPIVISQLRSSCYFFAGKQNYSRLTTQMCRFSHTVSKRLWRVIHIFSQTVDSCCINAEICTNKQLKNNKTINGRLVLKCIEHFNKVRILDCIQYFRYIRITAVQWHVNTNRSICTCLLKWGIGFGSDG
jgi:superfamily II DNA helicase RecQ